jgi:acyl carrier protein
VGGGDEHHGVHGRGGREQAGRPEGKTAENSRFFWASPVGCHSLPSRPRKSPKTPESPAAMNRQELSAVVLELLEKETGETYPALEDTTSLREGLNLDSLDMAGLVLHIESRFGIQIETELLEGINTVGDMLTVLETKLAAKASKQAA